MPSVRGDEGKAEYRHVRYRAGSGALTLVSYKLEEIWVPRLVVLTWYLQHISGFAALIGLLMTLFDLFRCQIIVPPREWG